MNEKIDKLIPLGESETLEFKLAFGKDVIETLCGFANHRGGIVLIGVSNDGKIAGISAGAESIPSWVNEIKQNTSPSILPDIEIVRLKNKAVVVMHVSEFPIKPVAYRDRYFKRVASSNHRLSLTEIANLHLQSLQLSWDSYSDEDATIDSLTAAKIELFLKRVKDGGRYQVTGRWQTVLEKFGYLKNGHPTHAAMLLFGKSPPPYNLHIGRFKTPSTVIDDRMIRGTLYHVVEDALKFVLSHIKVAFDISTEKERGEIYEYPLPALRELILNAVVHRDYMSPVDTQIKIFDKSITFFNPGRLFGDLTVDKLKRDDYQSRARNKLIAEAFYLTRDIEKYGSGFIRIRKEILSYPTMTMSYMESGDGFLVTLAYQQQKIASVPASPEGVNGGVNEGLTEGVTLLLENIRKSPGKRIPQHSTDLGVPEKTIERWIALLRRENRIEYRGSSRTGGYFAK